MSKTYLEFSNKGEVPVNAFKLLGASTKRGDSSKIGYFGTGLKYALAVLLREGIEFKIFSGSKEVKIGTRQTKFFDKKVTVITVNGEKTSITIEAGINWETWFAIREIYSNTIDEDGSMNIADSLDATAGYTKIFVEQTDKLKDLNENWSNYFSNTRSVISGNDKYKVLQKTDKNNLVVFRKGIQAYSSRFTSLFDYDVTQLKINESRVAQHDFEARQRCAEALALCDDKTALEHFANAAQDVAEKDPNFWTYLFDDSYGKFSETWKEVFADKRIVPTEYSGFYGMTASSVALPEKLCKLLYAQFKDELQISGATKENYIIVSEDTEFCRPAMAKLEQVGFGWPLDKVKIAKFKDDGLLGLADNGLVILSEKVKTPAYSGKLLEILFEEIAHNKSGYSDHTREFQDYIIALACALMPAAKSKEAI